MSAAVDDRWKLREEPDDAGFWARLHADNIAAWDRRFRDETGLWIIRDYAGRWISCPPENLPFDPEHPPRSRVAPD